MKASQLTHHHNNNNTDSEIEIYEARGCQRSRNTAGARHDGGPLTEQEASHKNNEDGNAPITADHHSTNITAA